MKKLLFGALALLCAGCSLRLDKEQEPARGYCTQIRACHQGQCQRSDYLTQTDCEMVGGQYQPLRPKKSGF